MKILIDAGHGINTSGKGSPYSLNKVLPALDLKEWKWAREIAGRICSELKSKHYDCELVVTEDKDISLLERCHRVNVKCQSLGKQNVLCVSIHGNALGYGDAWNSARGWSAYTSPGQTKSDILAEKFYDAAEKYFRGMSIRTEKLPDGDRDYEQKFYVLVHTLCPCVLTENFFYTNVDDCKFMLSEEGKNAIVKVHVEGIINYMKSI